MEESKQEKEPSSGGEGVVAKNERNKVVDKKARRKFPEADRMKEYEAKMDSKLDPSQPYIIRLDGHLFSKFTKNFKKPYDPRIFDAMLQTTIDCAREFKAATGFTQSDEISLVFPAIRKKSPQDDNKDLKYEGRAIKTATLAAGYCSVRFINNMLAIITKDPTAPTSNNNNNNSNDSKDNSSSKSTDSLLETKALDVDKIRRELEETCFDARVFNCPTNEEVVHCINWRIKDVMRNSKNNLGFAYFHHKELVGISPKRVLLKLKEKGVDWHEMPEPYKYGAFIKVMKVDGKVEYVTKSMNIGVVDREEDKVRLKNLGHMMTEKMMNSAVPEMQEGWVVVKSMMLEEMKQRGMKAKEEWLKNGGAEALRAKKNKGKSTTVEEKEEEEDESK